MDTFRWVSIVVSTILGLGIARSLTGAVSLFQRRHSFAPHWLPIIWAGCIFAQQILFWWGLEDLASRIEHWTIGYFVLLVALVVTLFLASAIILPVDGLARDINDQHYFERDGRWALLALAAFNALAILANFLLWGERLLTAGMALNLLAVLLPIVTFAQWRIPRMASTMAYVLTVIAGVFQMLPQKY